MTRPEEIAPAEALAGLEDCTIAAFGHAQHVAAAWEALRLQPFDAAAARISRALQRFAAHKGVPNKYDEPVTLEFMRLIDERRGALSWPEFCAAFPELLDRNHPLVRGLIDRAASKRGHDSAA